MSHETLKVIFISPLRVEEIADNQHKLLEPFSALVTEDNCPDTYLTVPVGFVTDYASVPRVAPIAYALFGGIGNKAATIHDFLYSPPGTYPREWADAVFRAGLVAVGIDSWKAEQMYIAVREFGGLHYNQVKGTNGN